MGRTIAPDEVSTRAKKGERGRGPRSTQPRSVLISKACSRLLRHQAVNEGVPITTDGWVRLDHLLAWKGLSSRNGVTPAPTLEDIWIVVEENEKKRFAVRWIGKGTTNPTELDKQVENLNAKDSDVLSHEIASQPATTVKELITPSEKESSTMDVLSATAESSTASEERAETETARAIAHYRNTSPLLAAAEFQIRAVQGHSIQTVASDTSLLKPITLSDPISIPETCVHGTFYGAWPLILRSGGLKRMGRNHVHFASGPILAEIGITEDGDITKGKPNEVISGMRHDAQLLIYVDLQRCLEDVKDRGAEMTWWKSENGVILTEGIDEVSAPEETALEEPIAPNVDQTGEAVQKLAELQVNERSQGGRFKSQQSKNVQAAMQSNKLVPMKYWKVVVDVKGGQGVIWKQGEGVVKDLPERLLSKGTPKSSRGRGRGGRGRGG